MNWQQYQEAAAEFFQELGMDAEVDKKKVQGARGEHDIDVWVTFSRMGFSQKWVIECKHWQKRVSKAEVLTLQQIVQDIGADKGILLSEKGFQKGALRVIKNTNVELTSLKQLRQRGEAGYLQEWGKDTAFRITSVRNHASRERRKLELINPVRQTQREQWGHLEWVDYMVKQLDLLGEGMEAALKGQFPVFLGYMFVATHDIERGLLVQYPGGPPVVNEEPLITNDMISVISYCKMMLGRYERWLNGDRSFNP